MSLAATMAWVSWRLARARRLGAAAALCAAPAALGLAGLAVAARLDGTAALALKLLALATCGPPFLAALVGLTLGVLRRP